MPLHSPSLHCSTTPPQYFRFCLRVSFLPLIVPALQQNTPQDSRELSGSICLSVFIMDVTYVNIPFLLGDVTPVQMYDFWPIICFEWDLF